jgi:hypothetical protein
VCQSPGFTKPTHGYGQSFPACAPAVSDPVDMGLLAEEDLAEDDDEDWAGPGYVKPEGA